MGVLMAEPGKRRIDELTGIGVGAGGTDLVAVLDGLHDIVDIRSVDAGINKTLAEEVERQGQHVDQVPVRSHVANPAVPSTRIKRLASRRARGGTAVTEVVMRVIDSSVSSAAGHRAGGPTIRIWIRRRCWAN